GATIQYGTFKYSRDAGIFAQSHAIGYNIYSNVFRYNGGSAIAVDTQALSGAKAYIQANEVVQNYINPVVTLDLGGSPGGQIVVGEGSTNSQLLNNFIDGEYAYGDLPYPYFDQFVAGIEIYGSSHRMEGNYVRRHTGPGIHAVGLNNSEIIGGANSWEIRENYFDGIAILNLAAIALKTNGVAISGIRANSNGWNGIHVESNGSGTITNVNITDPVSISGNGDAPICRGVYSPALGVTVSPSPPWTVADGCVVH
ncbi:MAG: hypothetical protein M1541_01730, partial [Acidobacteria bacterium]|nr:hypothetical protein [Acidobacteriota bacterium]